jgi:hypothetical protein
MFEPVYLFRFRNCNCDIRTKTDMYFFFWSTGVKDAVKKAMKWQLENNYNTSVISKCINLDIKKVKRFEINEHINRPIGLLE